MNLHLINPEILHIKLPVGPWYEGWDPGRWWRWLLLLEIWWWGWWGWWGWRGWCEDGDGSYSSRVLILLQSFPLKVIPRREWCVCRNKIFKISIPFFLDLAYFQQRGGGGECTADSTRSSLCTTGVEEEEDHLEFELSITSIVSTKLCNRLLRIWELVAASNFEDAAKNLINHVNSSTKIYGSILSAGAHISKLPPLPPARVEPSIILVTIQVNILA